jgi:hypothetical protein
VISLDNVTKNNRGDLPILTGRTTATDDSSEQRPSLFSEFAAKTECNGRVLSKYRVDSTVTSVFNHPMTFMEAKMMVLMASILKIDVNYKLASKIRVRTKQGHNFSPFKCLVTVQNEDGLSVFGRR